MDERKQAAELEAIALAAAAAPSHRQHATHLQIGSLADSLSFLLKQGGSKTVLDFHLHTLEVLCKEEGAITRRLALFKEHEMSVPPHEKRWILAVADGDSKDGRMKGWISCETLQEVHLILTALLPGALRSDDRKILRAAYREKDRGPDLDRVFRQSLDADPRSIAEREGAAVEAKLQPFIDRLNAAFDAAGQSKFFQISRNADALAIHYFERSSSFSRERKTLAETGKEPSYSLQKGLFLKIHPANRDSSYPLAQIGELPGMLAANLSRHLEPPDLRIIDTYFGGLTLEKIMEGKNLPPPPETQHPPQPVPEETLDLKDRSALALAFRRNAKKPSLEDLNDEAQRTAEKAVRLLNAAIPHGPGKPYRWGFYWEMAGSSHNYVVIKRLGSHDDHIHLLMNTEMVKRLCRTKPGITVSLKNGVVARGVKLTDLLKVVMQNMPLSKTERARLEEYLNSSPQQQPSPF